MRVVIYARYSTDLQREASIEDQVRVCQQRIKREGWKLGATYSDAATTALIVSLPASLVVPNTIAYEEYESALVEKVQITFLPK